MKKRNTFTVRFICGGECKHGIVERFLFSCNECIAVLRLLDVQPRSLPPLVDFSEVITVETSIRLFGDFYTYTESPEVVFVFADRIIETCLNLSISVWKVLTTFVNVVEKE